MSSVRCSASQTGQSLIEVLVAALVVLLLAAGAAVALASSLGSSGGLRIQAQAQSLAERSQGHLAGMNIDQLSNLDQTKTVTVNTPQQTGGATFYVHQTATYVSDSTGQASCSNPAADYLQTTSTVTWPDMRGQSPITLTSLLTPTIGSIAGDRGTLAVSVIDDADAGVGGATVTASGPTTVTGTTTTSGCVLFGDIPTGTYQVQVVPPAGTWVDAKTGQVLSATNPDTNTETVNAGSTAASSAQFQLALSGAASFTFTAAFPAGITPSGPKLADAPGVVLLNTSMTSPSFRVCAWSDTACPSVGHPDASFPAPSPAGATLVAQPLFPYTYSSWAGTCPNDEPHLYGVASDPTVVVASGQDPGVSLTLPAIVFRLLDAQGREMTLPTGAKLVLTDTGCNLRYLGYTGAAPTLAAGQAGLPLNTAYGTPPADTGLLADPGMPFGRYTACYQSPTGMIATTPTFTNQGSGEVVTLSSSSTTPGTC